MVSVVSVLSTLSECVAVYRVQRLAASPRED